MAVGLPIVASRIGVNIETIQEGVNGFLFETRSAEKLAEKLGTILTDENLRTKMSMQSSKRYLEEFSTKSQFNRYLKIYNSTIESK
jgi:glycosyltransferase involved in cell wall biosynthesis